jgi:hypothetical protein
VYFELQEQAPALQVPLPERRQMSQGNTADQAPVKPIAEGESADFVKTIVN